MADKKYLNDYGEEFTVLEATPELEFEGETYNVGTEAGQEDVLVLVDSEGNQRLVHVSVLESQYTEKGAK